MQFQIKCDVYNRLIKVTDHFETTTDPETKQYLSCLRLENKSGHSYAVVTNQKIAAIQYLGMTNTEDGVIHIINDETIRQQCETEIPFDSFLQSDSDGNLMTTFGWGMQDGCIFPTNTPMDGWREWFPDEPVTENKGFMYWDVDRVASLAKSSTSGKIYFPQFIDVDKPIIVRDMYDENWCGLFIPKPDIGDQSPKQPAEKPIWV